MVINKLTLTHKLYYNKDGFPCHFLVALLALIGVGVGWTPDRSKREEADLRDGPPLRHGVQCVQQLLSADAREDLQFNVNVVIR